MLEEEKVRRRLNFEENEKVGKGKSKDILKEGALNFYF